MFDVETETSLNIEQFEELHSKLVQNGLQAKGSYLSTRTRLLLVLHWLREKPKLRMLANRFQLSVGYIHKEISLFLPKLIVATRGFVSWPTQYAQLRNWNGAIGAIDCTAHPRNRVHPRQADWYRRDKGNFFLL